MACYPVVLIGRLSGGVSTVLFRLSLELVLTSLLVGWPLRRFVLREILLWRRVVALVEVALLKGLLVANLVARADPSFGSLRSDLLRFVTKEN